MKEIKDTIDTITSGRTWTIASQQIQAKLYQKDWQDAVFGKSPLKTASEIRKLEGPSLEAYQSELQNFKRADSGAKGLFYQYMGDVDYQLYRDLSAKDMWNELEQKYKEVHLALFEANYDKLFSTRIFESDDLETVLSKAYKISGAIGGLNRLDQDAGGNQNLVGSLGPVFKVGAVLRALPSNFAHLKHAWAEKPLDASNYTFQCLLQSLRTAYSNRPTVTKQFRGGKNPEKGPNSEKGLKPTAKQIPVGDFDCYTCRVKHHRDYQCEGWKKRQLKAGRDREFDEMKALLTKLQAKSGDEVGALSQDTENDDLYQCPEIPLALVTMHKKGNPACITLDSGCHPSFFRETRFFRNLRMFSKPRKLAVAYSVGPGTKNEVVLGQGDLVLPLEEGEIVLSKQYFAPGLSYNLLSEGVLDSYGYRVLREAGKALVSKSGSDKVLMSFDKVDGLYVRSLKSQSAQEDSETPERILTVPK